jgi:hypothetical protein
MGKTNAISLTETAYLPNERNEADDLTIIWTLSRESVSSRRRPSENIFCATTVLDTLSHDYLDFECKRKRSSACKHLHYLWSQPLRRTDQPNPFVQTSANGSAFACVAPCADVCTELFHEALAVLRIGGGSVRLR